MSEEMSAAQAVEFSRANLNKIGTCQSLLSQIAHTPFNMKPNIPEFTFLVECLGKTRIALSALAYLSVQDLENAEVALALEGLNQDKINEITQKDAHVG